MISGRKGVEKEGEREDYSECYHEVEEEVKNSPQEGKLFSRLFWYVLRSILLTPKCDLVMVHLLS